jgi:hypothetical protein
MSIWWQEPVHFRRAELRLAGAADFCSYWHVAHLPEALRDHYNACNPKAVVGQEFVVALS